MTFHLQLHSNNTKSRLQTPFRKKKGATKCQGAKLTTAALFSPPGTPAQCPSFRVDRQAPSVHSPSRLRTQAWWGGPPHVLNEENGNPSLETSAASPGSLHSGTPVPGRVPAYNKRRQSYLGDRTLTPSTSHTAERIPLEVRSTPLPSCWGFSVGVRPVPGDLWGRPGSPAPRPIPRQGQPRYIVLLSILVFLYEI